MGNQTKICNSCGKEKPLTGFYRGSGRFGRINQCSLCRDAIMFAKRRLPLGRLMLICPLLVPPSQQCRFCKLTKPLTEFYRVGGLDNSGQRETQCMDCRGAMTFAKRRLPLVPAQHPCPVIQPFQKSCSKCGVSKDLNAINFSYRVRREDGVATPKPTCLDCDRAAGRAHYTTVSPEARREYSRAYEKTESGKAARARVVDGLKESGWMYEHGRRKNLRRFGLTPEQYTTLFASQGNRCAICRRERADSERAFNVDHSHQVGQVRGILCTNCNLGLGKFRDQTALLFTAITYLTRSLPLIDRSHSQILKGSRAIQRDKQLRKLYDFTLPGFNSMLKTQGGVCAICRGLPHENSRGFHVDHIAGTRDIRGVLCDGCNSGLGSLKHNPTIIASAIWYLKKSISLEVAA